jgi:hypothetical protein
MNKIIKEALVKEIAESIMTDGNGRKATRLILEFDGKTDNTGRNQISVESEIRKHLDSRPLEKLVSGKFLEVMKIFRWLLGYTNFPARKETEKGAYYWRTHLRKKLYIIGIDLKMIEDKKFSR